MIPNELVNYVSALATLAIPANPWSLDRQLFLDSLHVSLGIWFRKPFCLDVSLLRCFLFLFFLFCAFLPFRCPLFVLSLRCCFSECLLLGVPVFSVFSVLPSSACFVFSYVSFHFVSFRLLFFYAPIACFACWTTTSKSSTRKQASRPAHKQAMPASKPVAKRKETK